MDVPVGKVIKILVSILSAVILATIILPLTVALLLNLAPVQNFVVRKATQVVSRELDTRVSIGRIYMKPFTTLAVEDFYVEDYERDTLLSVHMIHVDAIRLGLFKRHISLGDVQLSGVRLYMEQTEEGISNLKQILLKLKRKRPREKRGNFRLDASSVQVWNMAFKYRKSQILPKEYGVNFTDVEVPQLDLYTENLSVVGDSISMKIRNITLAEKSGFAVNALSCGAFSVSGSGLRFEELHVAMPDSELNMAYFRMLYSRWKMNDFLRNVRMEARLDDSSVSFQTIAYFAPKQRQWYTKFEDLDATIEGPVANLSGEIERAAVRNTDIALQFAMEGIPDIKHTRFNFDISQLQTDADDIRFLVADIAQQSLSPTFMEKLDNMGRIRLTGRFDGLLSYFSADAALTTAAGVADVNLTFKPTVHRRTAFVGQVDVRDFDLGRMLESHSLGHLSAEGGVNGYFGGRDLYADTDVMLRRVEFNDYVYDGIAMKGNFSNRRFLGNIHSSDPNLAFDFNGLLDFNEAVPHCDFDLELYNADLHRLNFNRRDSISLLTCRMKACGSGSSPDNVNGEITINDLSYVNHIDSIRLGTIRLVGENSEDSKYLALYSSFADVEFRSRMSYSLLADYFQTTLRSYLPTLSERTRLKIRPQVAVAADANNYSLLSVNVKQANNVAGVFFPGLMVASGTQLSFLFNPYAEKFTFTLTSDYIEHHNFFVSKLNVNSRNQADSISLFVRADDIYKSGFYMPDFSVIGAAKDNHINVAARFRNSKSGAGALIGVATTLGREPESGRPQVRVRFTPSYFTNGRQTWDVFAREILVDSTGIRVDNFAILSDEQALRLYGVASRSREDTLHVSMSQFDLNPLTQMTNRMGYTIQGTTSGHADVASALKGAMLSAHLTFDSVRVNEIAVPASMFESTWDFARERARFLLSLREKGDTVLLGYYRPTDGRYLGDVNLPGLDLALLDPLFEGVISGTNGTGHAAMRITGQRRQLQLNGTIDVPQLTTTVDFLNVPYRLENARLVMTDNVLSLSPTPLYDPAGNRGRMEINVDLNHLSNVRYDMKVQPDHMMVLNTTKYQNELFYGKIFASGVAAIHGDRRGVRMDIAASTDEGSSFYMPLSGQSDISEADFLTFETPAQEAAPDTTSYEARKRMIVERRARRQTTTGKAEMNIDMAVTLRPNTDIFLMDDELKARGAGNLNLHINPAQNEFTMYGDCEITEGSYLFTLQNIINKRFIIEPGSSIQWTGDPVDATLNISAVYKLKASLAPLMQDQQEYNRTVPVDCQINLRDKLMRPNITFNVTVPNAEPEVQTAVANSLNTQEMMATQFFWLLAANTFYADSGSSSSNIGGVASSATAFEFLSNQLSDWISSDKFNIGIRYRPKSEMTSDEVNIDFSTQLFSNRLLLEMEGNYDTGNNPTMTGDKSVSNFTGDFYLTWLIDRMGSLKAKAFTRTIDRFDENQGLQESGVGIYYKEDFNSFKDIIHNIRERFSGKRRKAKKEQQRREAEAESAVVIEEPNSSPDKTEDTNKTK